MLVGGTVGVTQSALGYRLPAGDSADFFTCVARAPILLTLLYLAATVALLLLAGARLRDLGVSPWLALAFPLVGAGSRMAGEPISTAFAPAGFVGLFALLCLPGTQGPNRFGPDPLAAAEDSEQEPPAKESEKR